MLRALTRQRHTLLRTRLFQMCGVDLTRIDGVDVTTALAVVSETGTDMSKFPATSTSRPDWAEPGHVPS